MVKKSYKHSEETLIKMRGRIPWNKGLTKDDDKRIVGANKGKKFSEETKKKMSDSIKSGFQKGRVSWNNGLTKDTDKRIPSNGGCKNPNWKGGFKIHLGYRCLRKPNHPNSVNGYVREHRLVMEKKIGRFLKPNEVVHHIDGNKLNNDINNLQLFKSFKEHNEYHNKVYKPQGL